ncbi:nuclear transport factor 2 family protein [Streptomyces mirabilis]|uniref:nuclear transport factor 2 family protein n=1 Tax=Streptomyces mirabilis TaxID=68239 RepID=UPI003675D7C4
MTTEAAMKKVSVTIQQIIAAGDLSGLRELYRPDAVVWHNVDDTEKSVDTSLEMMQGMLSVTTKRWYEEVRLTPTHEGFVQQHYTCAELVDGRSMRVPTCMVITLDGERVTRLEEYFESGAATPMLELLGAP